MTETPDDRPPMVLAMEWASRVITISLEMALPGLGGYWLDQRLGTGVLFVALGGLLGLGLGMWSLMKIALSPNKGAQGNRQDHDPG